MKRKYWILVLLLSVSVAQNSIVQQFGQQFADVADKVKPAVVTIISEKVIRDSRFHSFQYRLNPNQVYTLGSGVIVNAQEGYILTNNHVIDDVDEIKVKLIDKRMLKAELVGSDPQSDLAVLQVEANDLQEIQIGDSDQLRVGEWVLAVGSPFSANLSHTVTAGIVSALGRNNLNIGNDYEDFIQTDAAINPGNSGGALVNMEGELVGINSAIATGGMERANRGVGFAIPTAMAKKVMSDLISKGYVVRAWLGVYIQEVEDSFAKAFDLESRDGALVYDIVEDSPAEQSGIQTGDVIYRFNGQDIRDPANLKNIVSSTAPGTRAKVELFREGRKRTLYVVLEELKNDNQPVLSENSGDTGRLGLRVQNLTPSLVEKYGLDSGTKGIVVTQVEPESDAFRKGIRPGDIITRVGSKKVKTKRDFDSLVRSSNSQDAIVLLVKQTTGVVRFYPLELMK